MNEKFIGDYIKYLFYTLPGIFLAVLVLIIDSPYNPVDFFTGWIVSAILFEVLRNAK